LLSAPLGPTLLFKIPFKRSILKSEKARFILFGACGEKGKNIDVQGFGFVYSNYFLQFCRHYILFKNQGIITHGTF
jgi:hypothetical protein